MKAEWANTDSRFEIEEFDKDNVRITVVYEKDTYLTDEATVIVPKRYLRSMIPAIKDISDA